MIQYRGLLWVLMALGFICMLPAFHYEVSRMIFHDLIFYFFMAISAFSWIALFVIIGRKYAPRSDALKKSKTLLKNHLSDMQKIDFDSIGGFYVRGGNTGLIYFIGCNRGVLGNIRQQGFAHKSRCVCCYVPFVPKYDTFLVQKLMLECPLTERQFRDNAVIV